MAEGPQVVLYTGERVTSPVRTPEQAILSGLMAVRNVMTTQVLSEFKGIPLISVNVLADILDLVWTRNASTFRKVVAPTVGRIYAEEFLRAGARDVTTQVVENLGDDAATRLGTYFHGSSRDAAIQTFNTFVNRKVPARIAAERVLEGYGLTARQMAGLANTNFDQKVNSSVTLDVRRRVKDYIARSLQERFTIFARQENHNLREQAQQTAWMWMVQNGQITEEAEKVWITAKDERVCSICGPLHGKRVPVGERFSTAQGDIWTPGAHVNCRCTVRLVDPSMALRLVQKNDGDHWYDDEYVRSSDGRFSTKREAKPTKFAVKDRQDDTGFQSLLDEMFPDKKPSLAPAEAKPKLTAKPTLKARPTLAALPPAPTEKPTLAQQKVAMSGKEKIALMREKPSLAREKARMAIRDSVSAAMAETGTITPVRRKAIYRNTVKLDKPAFAVVAAHEMDSHGRVWLEEETDFYTDQSQVEMMAEAYFQDNIEYHIEMILEDRDSFGVKEMGPDGKMRYGWLADEDVWEVVGATAYENIGADEDWHPKNQSFEVEWRTEEGDPLPSTRISYDKAQKMIGVEPEMFEMVIVRLDEGYDDEKEGQTYLDQAETRHGQETWRTRGVYQTIDTTARAHVGHGPVPIKHYTLIPEVTDEVIEE